MTTQTQMSGALAVAADCAFGSNPAYRLSSRESSSMINEYDVVRLARSVDGVPIPIGTRGTVLIVHNGPPVGFEVEFVDKNGVYPEKSR